MKHIILPIALVLGFVCAPCLAGGLFAGDDNMHVQGHPYEASSYHKAYHGADSFETLPMHYAGYGHRAHYGYGYGHRAHHGYGYGHGYGYSRYAGYGHGGCSSCGCHGGGYHHGGHGCDCGCKKHFGWFKKCCKKYLGCCQSSCGCGEVSCCQPKCCGKKWYKSWFKGFGCGCGHSGCDTCDSCGGGHDAGHDAGYESTEEVMPEPAQNDDAAPVPTSDSSAQFRSILPPSEAFVPTSLIFPFLGR